MEFQTSIRDLGVGSVGVIVGFDRVYGGYTGKLLTMGLLPNTTFIVLSHQNRQGCVEIILPGKILTLSLPEANALCIEAIERIDIPH
jgi:ferrous iron transport protein A